MFNRIRISTSLFLLLISFCIMQLISTGLSYVALRADNHNLERITVSSQQRDALSLSWVSLLQASRYPRGAEGAAGAGGCADGRRPQLAAKSRSLF